MNCEHSQGGRDVSLLVKHGIQPYHTNGLAYIISNLVNASFLLPLLNLFGAFTLDLGSD